ncbi:hypothetical protein [Romboutsia ilealis]|nr:hypothetical protein [Romboutsia ilealis]
MYIWIKDKKVLTPMEMNILSIASAFDKTGKIPSAKQCKRLILIKEKAKLEGFNF